MLSGVERLQAYKFELMPTGEQTRKLCCFAGACRFVFNRALALQQARYAAGEKKLDYPGLCKLLTGWRNGAQTPWLADAPVNIAHQVLKDLERAYTNFFVMRANSRASSARGTATVSATRTRNR
jgi:putative transposase